MWWKKNQPTGKVAPSDAKKDELTSPGDTTKDEFATPTKNEDRDGADSSRSGSASSRSGSMRSKTGSASGASEQNSGRRKQSDDEGRSSRSGSATPSRSSQASKSGSGKSIGNGSAGSKGRGSTSRSRSVSQESFQKAGSDDRDSNGSNDSRNSNKDSPRSDSDRTSGSAGSGGARSDSRASNRNSQRSGSYGSGSRRSSRRSRSGSSNQGSGSQRSPSVESPRNVAGESLEKGNPLRKNRATTTIQNAWRMKQAKAEKEKLLQESRAREESHQKRATTVLQNAWRMKQAKAEKEKLLREKSAREESHKKRATTVLQNAWRMKQAKAEKEKLMREKSAREEKTIQKSPSFLKKQAAQERQLKILKREQEKAAVKIQAIMRGRLVRKYCSMDKRKKERELRRRRQDRQIEKELIMKRLADMERRQKGGGAQQTFGRADEPYQRAGYMSEETWMKRDKELAGIDQKLREIEDRRMGMQAKRAVQGDIPISVPKYTEVATFAPRTRTQAEAFLGDFNNIHNRPSPLASLDAYAQGGSYASVFAPPPLPTMRSRPASQPLTHRYLSKEVGAEASENPMLQRPYIPSRRAGLELGSKFASGQVDRIYATGNSSQRHMSPYRTYGLGR